ncbi:MAG: hypothetical protein IKV53_00230 [Clostridia bacterium]|nr:hypothetical protein [Clostridia bacterium]
MSLVKSVIPQEYDRREMLRYAGVREATPEIEALLEECLAECEGIFSSKVCYLELDLDKAPDFLKDCKQLKGCERAVIFVATVGIGIDRLIKKYGVTSPSKALMLQAIGTERIESLCDSFCNGYESATSRFSPGYARLELDAQREIFSLLNPERSIGVALNTSLLMSPSKSVSAIFGIRSKK